VTYHGEWNAVTGKRHGCGIEICALYMIVGFFYNDLPNGNCIVILSSGDAYSGPMKDGKMDGTNAHRVYANGDYFKGSFS
jgi:hypothetical protein